MVTNYFVSKIRIVYSGSPTTKTLSFSFLFTLNYKQVKNCKKVVRYGY